EYRNHYTAQKLLGETHTNPGESYAKPTLTDEQKAAAEKIIGLCDSHKPSAALLHGVTGSGKTAVIMEAIDHVLAGGRSVIMMVPEIALTPQTVGIFVRRYGDEIAVIHSGLSAGERYDAWRRIKDGLARVVVGTRSAVFAPLSDIGLIIIDEEHEYTYKSDTNPKYKAHDIARKRCADHNAVMLLASATPSVSSYYKAKTGAYTLIELKERYGGMPLPSVHIVDMRDELSLGNTSPVSHVLEKRLREDKEKGNQSILFLNRRGYNNYVSCRSCGKSIKCPNCSLTLTYHAKNRHKLAENTDEDYEQSRRDGGYLVCHMCGYRCSVPEKCPECGKNHFLFMGYGTQKAEDDIASMFPDLRILRMDYDTTQAKYSHEEILDKFRNGEADVLLGTQMVTKGHDFPRVATVGVLSADNSLALGDYRAGERTFAMLTQVIGRAGRGDVAGEAVIQTYNPQNDVILKAARQDYVSFYESEIRLRKALCFPPFCDIAVITLSSADEGYLGHMTNLMLERIKEHIRCDYSDIPMMLFGPFEAPVYRIQNMFRMRFVIKCRLNKRMREFISDLISEFSRSSPNGYAKSMPNVKTNARITVSADLNPSTV
ncbi:MAG: primosomal protein N', partial [Eubacteriales bacterium]